MPEITQKIEAAGGNIRNLVQNKINVIAQIRKRVANAIENNQPIPIINNLMPIVASLEVLQLAYSNIKSNKGSMTPGTTKATADDMSLERLQAISQKLIDKTFKFPTVRRTYLPKPGKNVEWTKENLIKLGRPLGMPDFDSKIVQEAIRLVLDAIYEPIFEKSNTNFGFRQGKGCHDAIRNIPSQTQGMDIAIEGDIKAAFPSLNHETLRTLLRKRISDERVISLVYDCCKAGIFDELQNSYHDPITGIPQGGIVSPLLWNIYMHEFDNFVLNDINNVLEVFNTRQGRYKTNDSNNSHRYRNALYRRTQARKKLDAIKRGRWIKDLPEAERSKAVTAKLEWAEANKTLLRTPSKDPKKARLRFFFVRYADDWIFFTNAKPIVAQLIKNKIAAYLKDYLGLTLSAEKTKITNLKKNKAKFLGFTIFKLEASRIKISKFGGSKRTTNNKVFIGIDQDRVIDRLTWRGYIDAERRPREQPALSTRSDYEIVMSFNAMIRGYVCYYCPVITERSSINYYVYILEYSCYKTLCQKHRTTIRKLLKKYGKPLTATVSTKDTEKPKSLSLITVKTYWHNNLDAIVTKMQQNLLLKTRDQNLMADTTFLMHAKGYWRTKLKFEGHCVICGSQNNVQMHHIKKVREYNTVAQTGFSGIMSSLNRKQVPVCKFHHDLIHDGKYDESSLKDLYDVRIAQVENHLKIYDETP